MLGKILCKLGFHKLIVADIKLKDGHAWRSLVCTREGCRYFSESTDVSELRGGLSE